MPTRHKSLPLTEENHDFSYLNALPSALIAVSTNFDVLYLNPAAEALLATSAQQANGKSLDSLPGFDEALCSLCERVLSTGEEISLFAQTLRLPLNHKKVTLHVTPIQNDSGKVMQLLITIEKSDRLDNLAASAWKQETTRAAGIMAAMLAHEVKNPLSGIRGAAQLLQAESTPEQQALTELICRETDRIRDLLDQVEIFADGVPVERAPINIHEVLQYVLQVAATGFARHVEFKERYDPSLPQVMGNRDLLVQLFLNLVKNAAEALKGRENAAITITTAYRSGQYLRLGASDEKISLPVAVSIEDNGPGIPQDVQGHLFEPFVSSKEEGRGLGLAIVAKIASDLGAVVELDKEFEGGACFTVWLAVESR